MRVLPPDLGPWMIAHVRSTLRGEGEDVEVGDVEPDDLDPLSLTRPLVVIREDPGSRLDWTTFDRSLGATVLWGTKQDDTGAKRVARLVASVMFDTDLPSADGSPIAAVWMDGCNGPYKVPDPLDVSRLYLTAQYTVFGSW